MNNVLRKEVMCTASNTPKLSGYQLITQQQYIRYKKEGTFIMTNNNKNNNQNPLTTQKITKLSLDKPIIIQTNVVEDHEYRWFTLGATKTVETGKDGKPEAIYRIQGKVVDPETKWSIKKTYKVRESLVIKANVNAYGDTYFSSPFAYYELGIKNLGSNINISDLLLNKTNNRPVWFISFMMDNGQETFVPRFAKPEYKKANAKEIE